MCELMEKYNKEAVDKATLEAVVNMFKMGTPEEKIKEFYPDWFQKAKEIFLSKNTCPTLVHVTVNKI